MDWWVPIRAYCERTDGAFWAEPFGAVSNAAFLVAALAAILRARRARDTTCFALGLLIAVIGLGSFLFHTLAVQWAMLADVIPIAIFVVGYFFIALTRLVGLRPAIALPLTVAFTVADLTLTPVLEAITGLPLGHLTNGSLDYFPAFAALLGVALILFRKGSPGAAEAGRRLALVALVFLVSLAFRTLDRTVCPAIPMGTHWLWHVLNAVVLYALTIIALPRPGQAAAQVLAGAGETMQKCPPRA